jgi:nucleotide-binding universal stress UspA family protein
MVLIKRILCPIDFSDFSRHAFHHAVHVARGYDAVVHVVHVAPVPTAFVATVGGSGVVPGIDALAHDQILEETRRFLDADNLSGLSVEYHVAQAPDPRSEILLEAQRLSADLIVMGTHGRTGFQRLLFGSVAERVLRESPIPVMTVPARADGTAADTGRPFTRILYATDFSTDAERALRYAASLAEHCAATLALVHVVELLRMATDCAVGLTFDTTTYEEELEVTARATLPELGARPHQARVRHGGRGGQRPALR